jgi:methylmalonyl-CoA/ethylmalonyl-CoA epimerase
MMRLHHIGVACRDIGSEIAALTHLHEVVECTGVVFDALQNAELALLTLSDGTRIELVAGGAVENLLKKKFTYYHLCFEVEDIDSEIERLVGEGAVLLSPPKPAVLFGNRKVAFLHVSYGIIELLSQINA